MHEVCVVQYFFFAVFGARPRSTANFLLLFFFFIPHVFHLIFYHLILSSSPQFLCPQALDELRDGQFGKVAFALAENGSGKGAGMVVAAACSGDKKQ